MEPKIVWVGPKGFMLRQRDLMRSRKLTSIRGWGLRLALSIIVSALSGDSYGQPANVALLLRQTPIGGSVIPAQGLYFFEPASAIIVTAVAEPGFEFVYWLGDVNDPTSTTTVVQLDKSKIVIAVFHRIRFEPDEAEPITLGGAFGSVPTRRWFAGEVVGHGITGAYAGFAISVPCMRYVRPAYQPQPIPEPATWLLLVVGGIAATKACRAAGARL